MHTNLFGSRENYTKRGKMNIQIFARSKIKEVKAYKMHKFIRSLKRCFLVENYFSNVNNV